MQQSPLESRKLNFIPGNKNWIPVSGHWDDKRRYWNDGCRLAINIKKFTK
ncbi:MULTISPECIES: hypothetical protein [unclassified Wolbachia]|nr:MULTISPECIES: hypothetical protein [unclassified Wolbachia]